MQKADERLDTLAEQVGNIESNIFSEDTSEVEVYSLLKSVNEVKNNYQNLRKDILEVQYLQKELSTSLQSQLRAMQAKFNTLKEKLVNVPEATVALREPRPDPEGKCGTSESRD